LESADQFAAPVGMAAGAFSGVLDLQFLAGTKGKGHAFLPRFAVGV
jgi:hypothetical protein